MGVPEIGDYPKGSGIEDSGNFSEGFCFKLNLNVTPGETFVICCEDLKTKTKLMELIRREKVRLQRACGNIVMPMVKKPEDSLTISELMLRKSKAGNCDKGKKGP